MSDIKGLQMEQDREGKIRNEDIDLKRTSRNFDFIESEDNLYHRVKKRVALLKATGSRVQTNSVVTYSNILTVPAKTAAEWGEEKTDKYFEACKDYFVERWGIENVVSAKVHKDETTPHMHLHFLPVNKENGKLQARIVMKRDTIYEIHEQLPVYLQQRGFEVTRAAGKTSERGNIDDVHAYKVFMEKIKEQNAALDEKIANAIHKSKVLIAWEDDLKPKMDAWKANQSARDKKLEEDTNKLEDLTKKLTDQQAIYDQQQLNIQTLTQQQEALEKKQQELDDDIQAKTEAYNTKKEELVTLTQDLDTKQGEYTSLDQAYATKQEELSTLKGTYNKWHSALENTKNNYQTYSNKYATVKADYEAKEHELTNLTKQTNTKGAEVTELDQQYLTKKADLETLSSNYSTLKEKYTDVYNQIRGEALGSVLKTIRKITYSTEHGDEIFRSAVSQNDFELSQHALLKSQNGRIVSNTIPVFQHIGEEIKKEVYKIGAIQDNGPSL